MLDGETLALDDDGRPRAFQDTMSRFGSDSADAGVRPADWKRGPGLSAGAT